MDKKQTFEEKLAELEMILEKLDDENTPLEESVSFYEKGVVLIQDLNETIHSIQGKIEKVKEKFSESNNKKQNDEDDKDSGDQKKKRGKRKSSQTEQNELSSSESERDDLF